MAIHALLTVARVRDYRVTHPDGTDETYRYSGSADPENYFRKAYEQKDLAWDYSEYQRWSLRAESTEIRGWTAHLRESGTDEVVTNLMEGYSPHGYPSAALDLLDELSQQGWKIIHVSEDRALYSGVDVPEESFLSRVRYLLARERENV